MNRFKEMCEAVLASPEQRAGAKKWETAVNALTEDFLKKVQAKLKAMGYKYSTRKASATISWSWDKGEKHIGFSGWHGTGQGNRSFGSLKMIHDLYITDTKEDTYKEPFGNTGVFVQPTKEKRLTTYAQGMPDHAASEAASFEQAFADKALEKYKKDLADAEALIEKRA